MEKGKKIAIGTEVPIDDMKDIHVITPALEQANNNLCPLLEQCDSKMCKRCRWRHSTNWSVVLLATVKCYFRAKMLFFEAAYCS